MFVARTAHRLPAGWNLPSNISHLIDFIDVKNWDLTLLCAASFPCLLRGQRTAYRRGGISHQTKAMSLISLMRKIVT
jgi:hypothetical protein